MVSRSYDLYVFQSVSHDANTVPELNRVCISAVHAISVRMAEDLLAALRATFNINGLSIPE